ncbi:hypothetical protein [uncultured Muribaculum sp.]|uniref:hypothetical protein n=1 Tax=uncultured Muribaculum sp. TaxID=1918613 RepID=UPI0025D55D4E|nr:hypothetical protein [uncultured Muribaculum sp.]
MKKLVFLFISMVIMCLTGCVHIHMTHLSDEDLEWVKSIYVHSPINFVSDSDNLNDVKYVKIFIHNSKDRFFFSSALNTNYEANAGYYFDIESDRGELDGFFLIMRKVKSDILWFKADCGARFTAYNGDEYERMIPLLPRDFSINHRLFDNCVVIDSTNSAYSSHWKYNPNNRIEKFVISKEHGLIYYKFEDGEEFFRQDLLPDSIQMKNQP